jgi:hypothetical protein
VNQCSVLYVAPACDDDVHVKALRALGFSVDIAHDLPPSEVFARYHAIVVWTDPDCNLPSLGTRLRAKPKFGRRVLIALVAETVGERQRRDAVASGFDLVMPRCCSPRDLAAHILRGLRPFPEYRCLLRTPNGRRKAA